jgi:hypothetical protein
MHDTSYDTPIVTSLRLKVTYIIRLVLLVFFYQLNEDKLRAWSAPRFAVVICASRSCNRFFFSIVIGLQLSKIVLERLICLVIRVDWDLRVVATK